MKYCPLISGHQRGTLWGGEEELTGSGLQPKQTLLILNSDGIVELFAEPFTFDVDARRNNIWQPQSQDESRSHGNHLLNLE